MTQLDAFTLADPKWFGNDNGATDPFGGSAPKWIDNGVATYTPPSARVGLLGDFLNRSVYSAKTGRFFNMLSWGDRLWSGLGWNDLDNTGWNAEKLGPYDPTRDWEAIPESTRNVLERHGYGLDALKKASKTPGQTANWFRDVSERTQVDSEIETIDSESGWVRYGSMKFASAAMNYVAADPLNLVVPGAGVVSQLAGLSVRATTASILASGAIVGGLNTLDTFDTDVRWQINHGTLDWESVSVLDYLGAAGEGAAFGTAFAAVPALLHYRASGSTTKAHARVADAVAGVSAPSEHPASTAVLGEYNIVRQSAASTLKERLGTEAGQFRHILRREVLGMTEAEHTTYLRGLIGKIDELKPTADELGGWLRKNIRFAPNGDKDVSQLATAMKVKAELEATVRDIERVMGGSSDPNQIAGLGYIRAEKLKKLASTNVRIADLTKVDEPGYAASVDRRIRGAQKRLAKTTDPVARKAIEAEITGLNARKDVSAARRGEGSQVPLSTRFTEMTSKLRSYREQAAVLAKSLEDNTATPTQRKLLESFNAGVRDLKKKLVKEYRYDPDSGVIAPRQTTPVQGDSALPTTAPTQRDAAVAFLESLDEGDDYMVHDHMSPLNELAHGPVMGKVGEMGRRVMTARTGQTRVIFSKVSEIGRFLGQTVSDVHYVNRDTKRTGSGRRSIFGLQRANVSKGERAYTAPVTELAKRLGITEHEISEHIINSIRNGTQIADPEIAALKQPVLDLFNGWLRKGIKSGKLSPDTPPNYLPSIHDVQAIADSRGQFAKDVARLWTERWSKSTEINRSVARKLGWLVEDADGSLSVTDAGRSVGLADKMPEVGALAPDAQSAYAKALPEVMRDQALDSQSRALGEEFVTFDEMHEPKVVDANKRVVATRQRKFDDETLRHPDMQKYLETDLREMIHLYSRQTATRFDEALLVQRMAGLPGGDGYDLGDLIATAKSVVYEKIKGLGDHQVSRDMEEMFDIIENKRNALYGRRPRSFQSSRVPQAATETLLNVSRTYFGGLWGLMSTTQEHLGQIFQIRGISDPRDFGRTIAAIVRAALRDAGSTAKAHADFGRSYDHYRIINRMSGSTSVDSPKAVDGYFRRIGAPWARAKAVVTGRSVPLDSSGSRLLDSAKAITSALAATTVEFGNLRYITGLARMARADIVKSRLVASLPKLRGLIDDLDAANLNDMTPKERIQFIRKAAKARRVNPDDAVAMNARGLLYRDFVDEFSGIAERSSLRDGWTLSDLKHADMAGYQRWTENHEHRLVDYIGDLVDQQVVEAGPWQRLTDTASPMDMIFSEFQSYARGFGGNLAYRAMNQMTMAQAVPIFMSFAIGEAVGRTLGTLAKGTIPPEELLSRWENDTARMMYQSISGVPFLGVWTQFGLSAAEATYDSIAASRDNPRRRRFEIGMTPMTSMLEQLGRAVGHAAKAITDPDTDIEMDKVAPVMNLIPGWGAWWFQSGLSAFQVNPRAKKD